LARVRKPRRAFSAESRPEELVKQEVSAAAPEAPVEEVSTVKSKFWVPIAKATEEKRLITGLVLIPNTIDAHGDTMSAEVIEQAAHDFLAAYNKQTTMGLMHKDFNPPIDLVESWVAPMSLVIGSTPVPQGGWVITVRVNDDGIWTKVKNGELTGFSIGGTAKVKNLMPKAA
jgi:DNA adenine methylase